MIASDSQKESEGFVLVGGRDSDEAKGGSTRCGIDKGVFVDGQDNMEIDINITESDMSRLEDNRKGKGIKFDSSSSSSKSDMDDAHVESQPAANPMDASRFDEEQVDKDEVELPQTEANGDVEDWPPPAQQKDMSWNRIKSSPPIRVHKENQECCYYKAVHRTRLHLCKMES